MCVVLKLIHDSSYMVIESYDSYIDDIIVANRVTYDVGYAYLLIR